MELHLEEMRNSWAHCKELLNSAASLDLVVAFLEDFKIQFTRFYQKIKSFQKNNVQKIAFSLVDSMSLFRKKQGELSQFISYVKRNWHAKEKLVHKMNQIDSIVSKIISVYAKQPSMA